MLEKQHPSTHASSYCSFRADMRRRRRRRRRRNSS
ncbi:hypothetical protein PSPO01_15265 [Paraphaeosphaeria sporulosa]